MLPESGSGFFQSLDGRIEISRIAGVAESNTTIVLLHEGLGCIAMWRDFPSQLGELTGFDVVVFSRIGYGLSDPCQLPRPLHYMHHEAQVILPQILSAINAERIILLGHSDGASIAAIHAGLCPDPRLAGLVLMAPHFFVEQQSIDAISEAGIAYHSGSLRPGLKKYHGENTDCAFRGWNQAWLDPGFRDWNIESCLITIQQPILFIQGRQDQYGSMAQFASLQRHGNCSVTELILDDCQHSPHRDQPEKTLNAIASFLQRD